MVLYFFVSNVSRIERNEIKGSFLVSLSGVNKSNINGGNKNITKINLNRNPTID